MTELDKLFQRTYEDHFRGELTDDRYSKLTASYTEEQKVLVSQISELKANLESKETKAVNLTHRDSGIDCHHSIGQAPQQKESGAA